MDLFHLEPSSRPARRRCVVRGCGILPHHLWLESTRSRADRSGGQTERPATGRTIFAWGGWQKTVFFEFRRASGHLVWVNNGFWPVLFTQQKAPEPDSEFRVLLWRGAPENGGPAQPGIRRIGRIGHIGPIRPICPIRPIGRSLQSGYSLSHPNFQFGSSAK